MRSLDPSLTEGDCAPFGSKLILKLCQMVLEVFRNCRNNARDLGYQSLRYQECCGFIA